MATNAERAAKSCWMPIDRRSITHSPEDVPAAVEPRRGLQEAVLGPRVPVRRPGGLRRRLHLHQVLHLLRSDEREEEPEEGWVVEAAVLPCSLASYPMRET